MAFATTNVKSTPVGNGLRVLTGNWTGTVGDSTGTITFAGGTVYGFQVWENSSGAYLEAPASFSVSGQTITFTVENIATVSAGRFIVFYS